MRIAQIYLVLMGAMSLVFGVVYLFWPAMMTDPMGFGALAPAAVTDVRATYGGFQIGMGAFLLWCLNPARVRAGLLLVLLTIGAVAICRAVGLAIDGEVTANLQGVLVFELVLAVVTLVLWLRTKA